MARRGQDEYRRDFTVTEPRAHPGGYTEYKVTATFVSKTTPDDVKEVVVWKRYSDLKRLHGDLALVHRHLFRRLEEFPPFPRAQVFGRFEAEVIEERRRAAETLLRFAARVPALSNSPQLRDFLRGGEVRRPLDACELPPLPPPLIPVPSEPREEPPSRGSPPPHGTDEPGPPSPAEEAEEEEEEEENTLVRERTEAEPPPAAPAPPPTVALSPQELALFDPVLGAGGPPEGAGDPGPGGGYVAAATADIRRALELEAAGDPAGALGCYRRGVRALLQGLPGSAPGSALGSAPAPRSAPGSATVWHSLLPHDPLRDPLRDLLRDLLRDSLLPCDPLRDLLLPHDPLWAPLRAPLPLRVLPFLRVPLQIRLRVLLLPWGALTPAPIPVPAHSDSGSGSSIKSSSSSGSGSH